MRIKSLAASFAILIAHGVATAAPPPPLMAPTGPWNVEFADSMCLLSREYGKESATRLVLKPSIVGNEFEVFVVRSAQSRGAFSSGRAVVTVAGKPAVSDASFTAYNTTKGRQTRVSVDTDTIALSDIRGTLEVDAEKEARHLFSIPGIEKTFPVLSDCLSQLRARHKITEADLSAIATKPESTAKGFFSYDDYPQEALRNGQSGTVGALVWIETDGRVSTCAIVESSGAPILDQTTCKMMMRRARFKPAKNAAGAAVRAPNFSRLSWIIP